MGVHVLFTDNVEDLRRLLRLARRGRVRLINAVLVVVADDGRVVSGLIRQSEGIVVLKKPLIRPVPKT